MADFKGLAAEEVTVTEMVAPSWMASTTFFFLLVFLPKIRNFLLPPFLEDTLDLVAFALGKGLLLKFMASPAALAA